MAQQISEARPNPIAHMKSPGKRGGGRPGRTWRTRKSAVRRQQIIEATLHCFLTLGYHRTTMVDIAKVAGITRGSIQYYFPTIEDVLRATIRYFHGEWLRRYKLGAGPTPDAGEVTPESIHLQWRAVRDPFHVAWQNLLAAARTDAGLAGVIAGILPELEATRLKCVTEAHQDLAAIDPVAFNLSVDFSTVFFEGLSMTKFADNDGPRKEELLKLYQHIIRQFWAERREAVKATLQPEPAVESGPVRQVLSLLGRAERLLAGVLPSNNAAAEEGKRPSA